MNILRDGKSVTCTVVTVDKFRRELLVTDSTDVSFTVSVQDVILEGMCKSLKYFVTVISVFLQILCMSSMILMSFKLLTSS